MQQLAPGIRLFETYRVLIEELEKKVCREKPSQKRIHQMYDHISPQITEAYDRL